MGHIFLQSVSKVIRIKYKMYVYYIMLDIVNHKIHVTISFERLCDGKLQIGWKFALNEYTCLPIAAMI